MSIAWRWLPLVVLLGASSGALGALWSVDDPRFAPPSFDPWEWQQWAGTRELLDVVASLSRLAVTAALAYLIVSVTVHAVALAHGSDLLTRCTARLNPAPLATLVSVAVLGNAPMVAAAPGALGPADDPTGDPVPVMRLVEDDAPGDLEDAPTPTSSTVVPRSAVGPSSTVVPSSAVGPSSTTTSPAQPVPGSTGSSDGDPREAPIGPPPPASTGDVAASGPGEPLSYVVVEGDHLWGIARRWVQLVNQREPSEAEVRDYWLALMEHNATRMVEPGNPNLLLPGQELVLP